MFQILRISEGPEYGRWGWNLKLPGNGRIIATAPLTFAKRSAALADVKRVQEMAAAAMVTELIA